MSKVYLDSSALFKRYLKEPGSTSLDHVFTRAEARTLQLAFSAWNIGEILGGLDEQLERKHLTREGFNTVLANFTEETLRMVRAGSSIIVPVAGKPLTSSWEILRRQHVYEADALQIASCKETRCELFLTSDRRLLESARAEGLNSMEPSKDEKKITLL